MDIISYLLKIHPTKYYEPSFVSLEEELEYEASASKVFPLIYDEYAQLYYYMLWEEKPKLREEFKDIKRFQEIYDKNYHRFLLYFKKEFKKLVCKEDIVEWLSCNHYENVDEEICILLKILKIERFREYCLGLDLRKKKFLIKSCFKFSKKLLWWDDARIRYVDWSWLCGRMLPANEKCEEIINKYKKS